jgi:hypothetical protein
MADCYDARKMLLVPQSAAQVQTIQGQAAASCRDGGDLESCHNTAMYLGYINGLNLGVAQRTSDPLYVPFTSGVTSLRTVWPIESRAFVARAHMAALEGMQLQGPSAVLQARRVCSQAPCNCGL